MTGKNPIIYLDNDKNFQLPYKILEIGECWLRPVGINTSIINRLKFGNNKEENFPIELVWMEDEKLYAKTLNFLDINSIANNIGGKIHERFSKLILGKKPFCSLSMNSLKIMGILNVTPDSFSDGGYWLNQKDAITHGEEMIEFGANIIDVGGESTKPNSEKVEIKEEIKRIIPVISNLSKKGYLVSADTRNSLVMQHAIDNGAQIINDVSGMNDPLTPSIIRENNVSIIIMHMQGNPSNMQNNPKYQFAPIDIFKFLENRIEFALAEGIKLENIAIDPGFGFGKTPRHNMQIISWLSLFQCLGVPLMLGASRKSSIGALSRGEKPKNRIGGSLVLAHFGKLFGAQLLRVHDVKETCQAMRINESVISEI